MDAAAVEPTWPAFLTLVITGLILITTASIPVIISLLRNTKARLDLTYTVLLQQHEAMKQSAAKVDQVERQTNGQLEAARRDALEQRVVRERFESLVREIYHDPAVKAAIDAAMERRRAGTTDEHFAQLAAELMQPDRRSG